MKELDEMELREVEGGFWIELLAAVAYDLITDWEACSAAFKAGAHSGKYNY